MNSENPTPKNKKGRVKKTLIIILITILSLIFLIIGSAVGIMYHYYSKMDREAIITLGEGEHMTLDDLDSRLEEIESYDPDFGDVSYVTGSGDEEYTIDWDEISNILAGNSTDTEAPEPTAPSDPTVTDNPNTAVPPVTDPNSPDTDSSSPNTTPNTPSHTPPSNSDTQPATPVTTRPPTPVVTPSNKDKVTNVLLIGRDLTGKYGLSDVMIVVSINDTDKTITLTSLLRDTYVYIPANRGFYNRLNASHSSGGTSLLIATIKRNFGINIDDYIKVDFGGVQKVFNVLGGVDLTLSAQEIEYINGRCSSKIDSSLAGTTIHLNGEQLLAHSRNRSSGNGDWGRTNRQRQVIAAIFDMLKTKSITELTALLDELFPLVTTDISFGTFTSYILKSPQYVQYNMQTFTIPTNPYWCYYRDSVGRSMIKITNMTKTIAQWTKTVYGT